MTMARDGGIELYTIYSTGCPRCKVLKAKMEQKGIEYNECQDIDKMRAMGIMSVPVLAVDDRLLTFEDAIKFINER